MKSFFDLMKKNLVIICKNDNISGEEADVEYHKQDKITVLELTSYATPLRNEIFIVESDEGNAFTESTVSIMHYGVIKSGMEWMAWDIAA